MRIRLGAPYKTITNKSLIPANEGMTAHVNQEIDYNLTSANKSYENALEADGVSILLWRKTMEGRRCTCKDSIPNENTSGKASEFNTNQENSQIRVRGSWDRRDRKSNFHKETLGVDIGSITPDDFSGKQEVTNFPSRDIDEISAFLNGPLDARALQSGEATTACGICFGSGWTNGYSLYRGTRLTFDSLNITRKKGFRLEKGKRPVSFVSSVDTDRSFVEWEFELPSFFIDTVNVQIRNNLSPVSDLKILIGQNGNFSEANKNTVNALKGQPGIYTLRVEPFNSPDREYEFTHIELVLQFSPWIKTQVPQLQSTTSFATPETLHTMEINLPPSVDKVSNEDIIYDDKYYKTWVITDTTDLQTANRKILNWSLQAKSLATYDIRSLMKVSKVPDYGVSFDGLNGDY